MPTSPKATTMPGGAPLPRSSKRPCKYGPRDSAGRCPKKPRAASARSKTASGSKSTKRPCKYGPRGSDGLCPKKPKTETVRKYATAQSQTKEAVRVLRSERATPSQRREAVKAAGVAVAVDAAKGASRELKREAKKTLRTPAGKELVAKAKKVAIGAASFAGKRVLPVAVATGTIVVAAKGIESQKRKDARRAAQRELAATKKRLAPQRLTADAEAKLLAQYEEFYYKQPVKNTFLGK